MELTRLLQPRSVAVVGATERPGSYGGEALLNLRRFGFTGAVHGVNPRRSQVHGYPCVPSLADLPEAPDAVVVAIPAADAPATVEQAGALGCGGAVVFAAGFGETADGDGRQERLVAAAALHGLPLCGPNGNGIVSLAARAALWGDMVVAQEAGPVALVSQSGNVAVNALASRRGLRLHTVVSSGNEAVLGAADYVEAIAALDGVRSIALYLEADGDGERWCAVLGRCAEAGIGVAVLKAGLTGAGAAAAQAHTGAVAGDGRVFRAFMEEAGAAWATDPHELLELAKGLAGSRRGGAVPGGGAAVMTCSGGDSSVAADLAVELGLPLPTLAPQTAAALEALLPAAATVANPLDYTSLLWDDHGALRGIVRALAGDPLVERVLVLHDRPAGLEGAAAAGWGEVLDAILAGGAEVPEPVLVASTLPELLPDLSPPRVPPPGASTRRPTRAPGPALAGLRTGLRVTAELRRAAPDPARLAAIGRAAANAVRGEVAWLGEPEAKALLRDAGLPVPEGRVVHGAAEAAAVQVELAAPVAMKATGLRHKSDRGGVELGVAGAAAARAAYERLAVREGDPVLVERMAAPGAELLVAARADGVVPALVVGLGGLWAEAHDDVAVLPLPAGAERVAEALRGLRGAALLTGGRGRPPFDLAAAAQLAAAAGELLLDEGLVLLELNPVIVHREGAVAADALAARRAPVPTATGARP